jgi:hypothetical protein
MRLCLAALALLALKGWIGSPCEAAVANSDGALEARVAGKAITGQGPFQVTIQGDRVTSKTYDGGATVVVK